MEKWANPPVSNIGFSINASRVRLDAYRLWTIFLAEEKFATLWQSPSDKGLILKQSHPSLAHRCTELRVSQVVECLA